MPFTFREAERAFRDDRISDLASDAQGLRFLKLRSLSRREHMDRLIADHRLQISANARELLEAIFDSNVTISQIESTIRSIYSEERTQRQTAEEQLVAELYRMATFDWGGLHRNSLEETIVNDYVKRIRSYDELEQRIENELRRSMRGYVLCSWYNHWTSIIIEDVFKDHQRVLPAVGLIKKVDFFIDDIPFDLKVTYLPEGFVKDIRSNRGLRPEITEMRSAARRLGLHIDATLPESRLLENLWAQLNDHPSNAAQTLIGELRRVRLEILNDAMANPELLIKWLYENQGVRRFDSSNRLFLVLVDRNDFFSSWKLKRAKALLVSRIHRDLTDMPCPPGRQINFLWQGTNYAARSDAIFIAHDTA